jgi:cytochrome b
VSRSPERATAAQAVWDLPVRLFHWLLVALLAISWITAEGPVTWMVWHQRSGYAVLALLLFRVMWGLWGSRYARFSSFVRGPRAVGRYALALVRRRPEHHVGHNPLGGWVVLLMLGLVGLQAGSGLFASDGIMTDGPLRDTVSRATSKLLTRIHHVNFNVLLAVVGVHVAAALGYWLVLRENLIGPMLTGRKHALAPVAPAAAVPWWRAALTALAAAGAVWWLVR